MNFQHVSVLLKRQITSAELTHDLRHSPPLPGFPLVPASIHAVARKKYFDDK